MRRRQVLKLYKEAEANPQVLYKIADGLRRKHFGNKVELCSIINAKSGNCTEDCKFCSQSVYHSAKIQTYPLASADKMVESAENAARIKAHSFGIVTSGDCINSAKELPGVCDAIKRIRKQGRINPDASLGRLTIDMAKRLRDAGLVKYHHNLETSREFFPNICTTHSYEDRIRTVKIAKKTALEACCGGLFGLGETVEQRINLAFTLKDLGVDSVPLNFLIPIPGTPLEGSSRLTQKEILMTIAIFRVVLPDKQIKVCAGREVNLKDRQGEIFQAGASGMMVGGYLTQSGNPPEEDLKMLERLGLELT
jgi:biotin synthase